MKNRILFYCLIFSFIVNAQSNHAALLKQYMEGQNKYFHFNGNALVAEKGKVAKIKTPRKNDSIEFKYPKPQRSAGVCA